MKRLGVVEKLKGHFGPTVTQRIDDDVGPSAAALLEGLQVACKLTPQGVIPIILLPEQAALGQALGEALRTTGVYHGIQNECRSGWFFNQFRLHCGCMVNVLSTTALKT